MDYMTEGTCRDEPQCRYPSYGWGCGSSAVPATDRFAAGHSITDAGAAAPPDDVTVYSQAIVGPYDTVVLGASTAAEVVGWLNDHGYDVPSESEPLLDPYAAQGHVFVALRLTANRLSDVLRPVVLHMPTNEACLPIRLTAIASTPSLPIEAIFLGDAQARSMNYSTAMVDLTPGLFNGTESWDDAVASKVRDLGGHAFATDFAGATPSISITLSDVTALAGVSDPAAFLSQLLGLGYSGTPLLLDLFQRFIQPPSGSDPQTYYNCLARGSRSECGTPIAFDPEGLATAIDAEITQPRADAQAMVDRHPYLTRLSTTIQKEDMTIDPEFTQDSGLPDVPQVRSARLVTECSSDYYVGSAPQRLEIGSASYPFSEGTMRTPEEECSLYGGHLASSGGGCSSTLAGAPLSSLLVLAGVGVAAAFRARRRRR